MKHKILLLLFLFAGLFSTEKANAQCGFYWFGYESHSVTPSSITINWSKYDSGPILVNTSYKVWYRLNDYRYGTSAWAVAGTTGGTSFTKSGLDKDTTYEFMVERWCNGNYMQTSSPQSGITTSLSTQTINVEYGGARNLNVTYINYFEPVNDAPNSYSAVRLTFDYGYTTNPSYIEYMATQIFYQIPGRTDDISPYPGNSTHNTNNAEIYNLTPNMEHKFIVRTHFKKHALAVGESDQWFSIDSYVGYITPQIYTSCGSKIGNYNAPALYDDGYTNFYVGTINSASKVTQSSVTHTFEASVVNLYPGFDTAISGIGGLIAKGFNPTNCATAKTSGATKTHTVSGLNNLTVEAVANEDIQEQKEGIKVYPNPTTGILNIHSDAADEIIKQIAILSETGQIVLSENGSKESTDISKLANGLYIYKVETNQGNYTGKVIKK